MSVVYDGRSSGAKHSYVADTTHIGGATYGQPSYTTMEYSSYQPAQTVSYVSTPGVTAQQNYSYGSTGYTGGYTTGGVVTGGHTTGYSTTGYTSGGYAGGYSSGVAHQRAVA